MTSLAEIEAAIAELPETEVRQLAAWLQDYYWFWIGSHDDYEALIG
ncbi:MAG: hypothetical protein HC866_08425 [Leptolyngbyaceae cyanobacterium RU_5_1]|nr:hypothetical protein [Leptolyngbyaceae cyanobacterium RU_5_1]